MSEEAARVETEEPQWVVVRAGGASWALPVSDVREVVWLVEPTPMPGWPPMVLGVMEVRGELMPMLDLSELLGAPPSALSVAQFVVLTAAGAQRCGLVVDAVEGVKGGVTRVASEAPGLQDGGRGRRLLTHENGHVVVLDLERLLAPLSLLPATQVDP